MDTIIKIIAVMLVYCLMCLLTAIPVYFIWNALMPDVFGVKNITFWQSMLLCWLCALLFKSYSTSSDK